MISTIISIVRLLPMIIGVIRDIMKAFDGESTSKAVKASGSKFRKRKSTQRRVGDIRKTFSKLRSNSKTEVSSGLKELGKLLPTDRR